MELASVLTVMLDGADEIDLGFPEIWESACQMWVEKVFFICKDPALTGNAAVQDFEVYSKLDKGVAGASVVRFSLALVFLILSLFVRRSS